MHKRSLSIAASAALAIAVFAASVAAAGTTTGSNGNSLSADAKITPTKLSKGTPTPASVEIDSKVSTASPITKAVMDFDKSGEYNPKGLPTCSDKKIGKKDRDTALMLCKKAVIGGGSATALVSFFGQAPQEVKVEIAAFNGPPKGGKPTVVFHAYAKDPAELAVVFTGVVSKYKKEGYGTRLDIDFPTLFGGSGAIREFKLKVGTKFSYRGKKRSLITAKCPSNKKLKSRIAFSYRDGDTLTVRSTQTCKPKS